MLVNSLQYGGEEGEEANVLVRSLSRLEEIQTIELRRAGNYLHRPVAMLARTVDSRERFLVQ